MFSSLEDYTDDIALLSHTHRANQEKKTWWHNKFAQQISLNINSKKTELIAVKISHSHLVKIKEEELPYVGQFTYLGMRTDGGANNDIQSK